MFGDLVYSIHACIASLCGSTESMTQKILHAGGVIPRTGETEAQAKTGLRFCFKVVRLKYYSILLNDQRELGVFRCGRPCNVLPLSFPRSMIVAITMFFPTDSQNEETGSRFSDSATRLGSPCYRLTCGTISSRPGRLYWR